MNLWLASAVAHAASVTVNPGDDLNALTASLQPGDVVTFNAGVYVLYDTVYWSGLGTADAPIVFKPAGQGEVVLSHQDIYGGWVAQVEDSTYLEIRGLIFEGPPLSTTTYGYGNDASGLYVANSSNVTIEDCVVRSVGGTALRIDGNTSGMAIRHNELAHTGDGSGLYIGCGDASCWMQDSVVEFNLIHDVEGYGIYLSPGTQSTRLLHNVIFRSDDTGIVLNTTAFGPQNEVIGNAIWEGEDDGIYVQGSALIQNNLVFQMGGDGIESRNGYNDDGLYDVQISHNTVALTDGWAALLEDWFDREDLVFANNALANPTGYALYWDDWNWDRWQDYYGTPAYESTNYLSHNVVTGLVDGFDPVLHPEFIVPGGGTTDFEALEELDFYPTATSMLRDQGDANGAAYIPQVDFNGTNRDGESPDVGAYEYDGDGNPGWVVQEGFKEFTPSEGRNTTAVSGGCCGAKADGTTAFLPAPLLLLTLLRRRR